MFNLIFSRKLAVIAVFLSLALLLTGCFKKSVPLQTVETEQPAESQVQTGGLSASGDLNVPAEDITISTTEDELDSGSGNTKIRSQGDLDSLLNTLDSETDDSRIKDVNNSDIDQF